MKLEHGNGHPVRCPLLRKLSVWLFLAGVLVPCAFAQQLAFNNYTLEDGLPQSQVYDILQDSRGYIWFGTYGGGATRFDGKQFASLSEVSHSTHYRIIHDIHEDRHGAIWFATAKGAARYDGRQLTTLDTSTGLPGDLVYYIAEDDQGILWFGTENGLARYAAGRVEAVLTKDDLPNAHIETMAFDRDGTLWLGTAAGVTRYADGRVENISALGNAFVNDILVDRAGVIWIGGTDGLLRYDGNEVRRITANDGLPALQVISLLEGEDGRLWIGTQNGIVYLENGVLNRMPPSAFDDDPIWSLMVDMEKNFWIGTSGKGVFKSSPSPFRHLRREDGLSDDIVWNFAQTPDSTIWIGTMDGLTRYKNGIYRRYFETDGLYDNEIRALHTDKNGTLWVGSTGGIQTFDGAIFSTPAPLAGVRTKIRSIYEEEAGLWFVTDEGAFLYSDSSIYNMSKEEIGGRPNGMVRDLLGNLWFVTTNGLYRYDGSQFKHYDVSDGLSHSTSLAIALGPKGNLWVGTYGGITFVQLDAAGDPVKFDVIKRSEGIMDEVTYFVLFDRKGNLWSCTNSGLHRFEVLPYLINGTRNNKFFDKAGGFIGQECNTQAAFEDRSGALWFGTVKGATQYIDHLEQHYMAALPLHIVGINLFYERPEWLDYADTLASWTSLPVDLVLPYSQNHLTFEFEAPGFRAPEKIRYRYKLEGFDSNWSPAVSRREATYANLPPGTYTFHVITGNEDGRWSPNKEAFTFTITEPFWQRSWFILLAILSVTFIIFLVIRLRTAAYEQQQKALEEMVRARTDDLLKSNAELENSNRALLEAREEALSAVRTKSEFLANMSHEIRTPLNGIIGFTSLMMDSKQDPENQEYLEIIRSSGENLLTIINDILDFSKIEAGKVTLEEQPFLLHACIEEALDLLVARAAEKKLELTHFIDPLLPNCINGDVTRLRQVIVNLLSNAVKFSEKGEISVIADLEEDSGGAGRYVHIAVSDQGIGIPEARLDSLFESFEQVDASTTRKYGGTGLGLSISRCLCELMGGQIWVESELRKGSTFHFTIELKEADERDLTEHHVYSTGFLRGKKILVVDDVAPNRALLTKYLTEWGAEVVVAASGEAALHNLHQDNQIDIALIDVFMPGMDGSELAAEMEKNRRFQRVSRIMMAPLRFQSTDTTQVRWTGSVNKPIKRFSLYKALQQLFKQHTSDRKDENNSVFDKSFGKKYPLKLLVAEDNVVNQKVISKILDQLGYRADIASNGQEVVDALHLRSYDLILMDMHMPEMDGLEATRRIFERWKKDERPDVIAMTAAVLEEDRNRCKEAGIKGFVSKPVKIEMLIEALRNTAIERGVVHEEAASSLAES